MKRIVHISDIHFGREDANVVERLIPSINEQEPDLIVVSGDLTQRAKRKEFAAARAFLDRLSARKLIVPGNHDVPLYNVFDRFAQPLKKYREMITGDLSPFYVDEEMAVTGVNTARSMTIKNGWINAEQIAEIRQRMDGLSDEMLKVVVTHHPFDVPDGADEDDIVGRADMAMPLIAECGADVFLSGHLHVSHVSSSARRYRLNDGYMALIIQAGTAASVRVRGEMNSFNVIDFDHPFLSVSSFVCSIAAEGFKLSTIEKFSGGENGWAMM